ncbi:MAG TPA: PilZ domain-containing protein [Terriglobales bacterium]|nr:PilZ domain-containing protein [Terriglobales bacterium]
MEQPEQRAERPTRWGKAAERQWPRFKVDFSVKIVTGTGVKITVQGRAQDLSEGGLGLYASVEFLEGQQVQIEFTPPFCRRLVETLAIVRDRDGYRYGLEFRKLTQQASEDLSRACRALALSAE